MTPAPAKRAAKASQGPSTLIACAQPKCGQPAFMHHFSGYGGKRGGEMSNGTSGIRGDAGRGTTLDGTCPGYKLP